MAKASTAVAEKPKNEVATINEDAFDNLPSGMENVTSADLKIPKLGILQALSPQLKKSDPLYIEGASQGEFADTGINQVFKVDELPLLPVYFAKIYLEWAPRDSGKGLVANHGLIKPQGLKQDDKMRLWNGDNLVQETATFYVLNLAANWRRSFVPLVSTQLKAARQWLTLINAERRTNKDGQEVPVPIYYRSWNATVVDQKNNQGDWFGWKFNPGQKVLELDPTGQLLKEAVDFMEQIKAGIVKADVASMGTEAHAATGDEEVM